MSIDILAPAVRRERLATVSLTGRCQSFQALSMGGIALLLPLIRQDLGLTFTQGGTLSAAATLIYALMQIPSGYLSDHFSPKRLFIIGIFGSTVLSLTFGLVTEYWQALLNQIVSGIFRAFLFVPGMSLITNWFPADRRATATGLYLVGGATGSLIFNLAGPLIVEQWGWRAAFISLASFGIVAIFFLLVFGKDSPATLSQKKDNPLASLKLFRFNFMWVCGGIQFIRLGVMMGITYWLPSLLVNEKGFSIQTAGIIAAVQAVLMAPSNILGGYISDRLKNPVLVIAVSLAMLGVSTGILITAANVTVVIIFVFVNAIFLQMYFGPLFSIPVEILGAGKAGISSGFSNFFANLGGFSATFLLGAIKDSTGGFRNGFLIICAACAAGFILTLVLAHLRKNLKPAREN